MANSDTLMPTMSTWPPSSAVRDSEVPLNGMSLSFAPAARSMASAARWPLVPTPLWPMAMVPGLAFTRATRSAMSLTGLAPPATTRVGSSTTRASGIMSAGSYCGFLTSGMMMKDGVDSAPMV